MKLGKLGVVGKNPCFFKLLQKIIALSLELLEQVKKRGKEDK